MYLTDWKMTYEEHKNLPCQAPCSMYSVLLDHKIIEDPFYGVNEKECTKLSDKGCKFSCTFTLSKEEMEKEYNELTFLGLDTLCAIRVNGSLLDRVENMHRAYT